jgi:hypothetical protein
MTGDGAHEEDGLGGVDDLGEGEGSALDTRGEECVAGLVAGSELIGLGDGVVLGVPLELDGVTDGCVDGERNVTEDTLGRCNDDSVGSTSSVATSRGRSSCRNDNGSGGTVLGNTF